MQTDHLATDWTFRIERVQPPSSQELDELRNPHGQNAHVGPCDDGFNHQPDTERELKPAPDKGRLTQMGSYGR
jgi:hypothetical protein